MLVWKQNGFLQLPRKEVLRVRTAFLSNYNAL
jgi:hypothetical protein